MDAYFILPLATGLLAMGVFAVRVHAAWKRAETRRKDAAYAIIDPIVRGALRRKADETPEGIAASVVRGMKRRGYDIQTLSLVTPAYIESMQRIRARRTAATHRERERQKEVAAAQAGPYRAPAVPENARRKNLEELVRRGGLDPHELAPKKKKKS